MVHQGGFINGHFQDQSLKRPLNQIINIEPLQFLRRCMFAVATSCLKPYDNRYKSGLSDVPIGVAKCEDSKDINSPVSHMVCMA